MTNAIETTDLARTFGRLDAVHGLTLQVPAGSIFALTGPNGAGKTTTIKLLMNLIRPSAGSATVLGTDSRRLAAGDFQRIGYVSENQGLPDWMTPGELLDYCRPLYPAWDETFVRKLQQDLGLTAASGTERATKRERSGVSPSEPAERSRKGSPDAAALGPDAAAGERQTKVPLRKLSRGTRMKAALLASLAYRPELVVLDEPFTGLDPLVRDELIHALLELPEDRERTVFISSHDVDEVERLADWIGFMNEGRLVLAEPVATLLARFRVVEVVAAGESAPQLPLVSDWQYVGASGRTLKFIDTAHNGAESSARIAAAFPTAQFTATPMPLRDIFVALARARVGQARGARDIAEVRS